MAGPLMPRLHPHATRPDLFVAIADDGSELATGTLEVPYWHDTGFGSSVPVHFTPQVAAPETIDVPRDDLSRKARPAI